MRPINVSQGSPEWLQARLGIPTASGFHRIIQPKRQLKSESFDDYACDLVAERFLGRPLEMFTSAAMQIGTEREEEAAAAYSLACNVEPELVGLITTDDGLVGASPDRLIGSDGLLELKSPEPHTHIRYLLCKGPDEKYRTQLQGQLWVCEREWVDICSYHPGLPEAIVRVGRDEDFIGKLKVLAYELVEVVSLRMEKLKSMGYEPPPVPTEEQVDWLGITDADVEAILGSQQ